MGELRWLSRIVRSVHDEREIATLPGRSPVPGRRARSESSSTGGAIFAHVWKLVTGDEPGHIRPLDQNTYNNRFSNLSAGPAPAPLSGHPRLDIRHGDCRVILKMFADNFVDAVVTDPPYHLSHQ
jgi:hypothetical protein